MRLPLLLLPFTLRSFRARINDSPESAACVFRTQRNLTLVLRSPVSVATNCGLRRMRSARTSVERVRLCDRRTTSTVRDARLIGNRTVCVCVCMLCTPRTQPRIIVHHRHDHFAAAIVDDDDDDKRQRAATHARTHTFINIVHPDAFGIAPTIRPSSLQPFHSQRAIDLDRNTDKPLHAVRARAIAPHQLIHRSVFCMCVVFVERTRAHTHRPKRPLRHRLICSEYNRIE